jgi:cardiolipin synthase
MTPSASGSLEKLRFFFEGDAFFDAAIEAIDHAQHEILIETYIYDWDRVGQRFLEALGRARARKVDVHLMVDGVGSIAALEKLQVHTDQLQIDFRVYHPPLFFSRLMHHRKAVDWSRLARSFWNRILTFLFYVNKRNHRKTILIDQNLAFVGSFNLTEVHSASARGNFAWRDTGVQFHADKETLSPLIAAFQRAWLRSRDLDQPRWRFRRRIRSRRNHFPSMGIFRLNDTLQRRFRIALDLRRRLLRAEKRILITNAYFLPRPKLLRFLRAAARRGVFVGLILPRKTDAWMVREAGRTMLSKLIKDGVQVFEYQPVILHAKSMVVDDWGMVGSHNLNHRSLIHDLEVDVTLTGHEQVSPLVQQWKLDTNHCHALTLRELDSDSAVRRLVGRLVYLVRYWM